MAPTRVTHPADDGRGEHFRVRIEGFGVGTWDLDLQTHELEWSGMAKRLFGLERDRAVSYDFFLSLLEPGDRAHLLKAIGHTLEVGGGLDLSFKVGGTSGAGQWIRARAGVRITRVASPCGEMKAPLRGSIGSDAAADPRSPFESPRGSAANSRTATAPIGLRRACRISAT